MDCSCKGFIYRTRVVGPEGNSYKIWLPLIPSWPRPTSELAKPIAAYASGRWLRVIFLLLVWLFKAT